MIGCDGCRLSSPLPVLSDIMTYETSSSETSVTGSEDGQTIPWNIVHNEGCKAGPVRLLPIHSLVVICKQYPH